MNQEMKLKSRKLIISHEGYEYYPYKDSIGNLTIGVGRNISPKGEGLLASEIDFMLENDILYFYVQLNSNFPWFCELNEDRQVALIDMCFMGFKKFCSFENMIYYLSKHDYENAAKELMNSLYAKQVGKRAFDLSEIIIKGYIYE